MPAAISEIYHLGGLISEMTSRGARLLVRVVLDDPAQLAVAGVGTVGDAHLVEEAGTRGVRLRLRCAERLLRHLRE